MKSNDFSKMQLSDLTNSQKQGPLMVYKDHYWAVDSENNVFFFRGKSYSPQCNVNKLIVERHLANGLATKAVFVPWAFVKFDIGDYV